MEYVLFLVGIVFIVTLVVRKREHFSFGFIIESFVVSVMSTIIICACVVTFILLSPFMVSFLFHNKKPLFY